MKTEEMTVLMTGACGGIGRALAIDLAKAGANLYLTGRDQSALDDLRYQIINSTRPDQIISTETVDLADNAQLNAMLDRVSSTRQTD